MAIFKGLSNKYISVTQELLKKIYKWRKVRTSLAKVFNNLKFVTRAIKEKVWPIGFRRKVNTQCLNYDVVGKKISTMLMKENIDFLYASQRRLKQEESKLRSHIFRKLSFDSFVFTNEKIEDDERKAFMEARGRQIEKFERLKQEKEGNKYIEESRKCNTRNNKSILSETIISKLANQQEKEVCKNNFINLSDRVFNFYETKLLNRNLEFIPRDECINKLEVATEVEVTMNRMKLKDDTFPNEIRKIYKNKDKQRDNLSREERNALNSLSKDNNIIIASSDKGKVTVVVNKSEYDRKLYEILLGGDYSILDKDPSDKIDRQIRNIAKRIKKEENQHSSVYHKIVGHHTRHPSVFGSFKIHKTGNPLRIIISSFNSVTSNAANFTKTILNDIVENLKDEFMLKNVIDLKNELLNKGSWDSSNKLMISIDVKNMFGSINPEVAIEAVKKLVEGVGDFHEKYKVKVEDFIKLVEIVLRNSYFLHEGSFYKQDQGIPMGSGLSPIVADIVMINLENKMRDLDAYKKVDLYKRYRDDSFMIWEGNRGEAEEFLEDLNTLDKFVKFTMEVEVDRKLPYLDALLTREEAGIKFKVYSKPYASGNMLRFESFHDLKVKRGIVIGETIRRGRISDEKNEDWNKLKTILLENGYPEKFIDQNMEIGKRKVNEGNTQADNNNSKDKGFLVLPFSGKNNTNKLRKLGKGFNIKPVFKKCKNLKGWFSKSYKENTNLKAGAVYCIDCDCSKQYIGETGDYLDKRIKKHIYSVKTLDVNNGIAVHSLDCDRKVNWNEAKLMTREGNWWRRKIKESLYIQQDKPSMNITQGYKLVGNWN